MPIADITTTAPTRGYTATKDALLNRLVALGLLDEHARQCVMGAEGDEHVDKTDELMAAVGRRMRRG